jgi:hypothetical protein
MEAVRYQKPVSQWHASLLITFGKPELGDLRSCQPAVCVSGHRAAVLDTYKLEAWYYLLD